MSMMQAVVPSGMGPGSTMVMQSPDGQQFQVNIPDGVKEGDTFQFMGPAPAPQPAVAVAVPAVAVGGGAPMTAPLVAPAGVVVGVTGGIGSECPPGAEPGGTYINQQYIGTVTLIMCIIVLFLFWPATAAPLSCPCDNREVYRAPNGATYLRNGQRVGTSECCGHPCQ
mmetsp:Transcript_39296/g.114820  ORF Transcript_39296/g.114820 Transcript_39296/m.114820 type:complete len:168 (-) Transcript_39296:188-691(-)